MSKEIRADSVELARLAADVLTAADGLGAGLAAGRGALFVPSAAFGNAVAGTALHSMHERVVALGAKTGERLLEMLEGDVDRIYRVAFAYEELEDVNTGVINGAVGGPL